MSTPPAKILIADDDRALLQALQIRLKSAGFEVITAADSYQAVQHAQQHQPDLAILDISMPAGDGFSVQQRLQKIGELPTMPIIYLTGDTTEATKRLAMEMGAFHLLTKPFEDAELLACVRAALGETVREAA